PDVLPPRRRTKRIQVFHFMSRPTTIRRASLQAPLERIECSSVRPARPNRDLVCWVAERVWATPARRQTGRRRGPNTHPESFRERRRPNGRTEAVRDGLASLRSEEPPTCLLGSVRQIHPRLVECPGFS